MKIGFTGTRSGMTAQQRVRLQTLLEELGVTEFHHGDCVGSDEQAHELASILGARVIVHPPSVKQWRAFCTGDEIMPEHPYLIRNRHIVASVETMIATPGEMTERTRSSGTWATIRYSRWARCPINVIWPDGSVS